MWLNEVHKSSSSHLQNLLWAGSFSILSMLRDKLINLFPKLFGFYQHHISSNSNMFQGLHHLYILFFIIKRQYWIISFLSTCLSSSLFTFPIVFKFHFYSLSTSLLYNSFAVSYSNRSIGLSFLILLVAFLFWRMKTQLITQETRKAGGFLNSWQMDSSLNRYLNTISNTNKA